MPEMSPTKPIDSLSPVFPSRFDVADALGVLNASLESSVARQLLMEASPLQVESDSPIHVMEKCRAVIDDLQFELDAERGRVVELESSVESVRAELNAEKKKLREERSLVEELLDDAKRRLAEKDHELENMTQYCEKRITEMKRTMKEASTSLSTPPLPHAYESIKEAEHRICNLTEQVAQSVQAIKLKDRELQSVVDSYEKQVRMLRSQLKSSEDLLTRLSRGIATPSPSLDTAHVISKGMVDSEFTKLNKTSLSFRGGPNPFSSLN